MKTKNKQKGTKVNRDDEKHKKKKKKEIKINESLKLIRRLWA